MLETSNGKSIRMLSLRTSSSYYQALQTILMSPDISDNLDLRVVSASALRSWPRFEAEAMVGDCFPFPFRSASKETG